ncbi:Tetracycline resistance protein from transposon [Pleurostoma richardsiae]|uniref:Tetracycline resistance protein from transposon n=1 Tax=Pleurostoma richardsiae TaxID=41990 RepID=A0AA38RJJ5_9PEZI|nr:Tetracycline resistance protein from transposon [Pleurostoma richardsiae]
MTALRIAIIGAGPAGCTLARLLSLSPVPIDVTVFEGEASIDFRDQGGTLDLHTATGLAALKEAGLWDKFLAHARYEGESLLFTDKDLKIYFQIKPSKPDGSKVGGQRPEIDRADLRRILLESLPEGIVRWGRRLRRVEAGDGDGGTSAVSLVFDDEIVSGFDLVVGADGAWSKVRPLLRDEQPAFAGVGAHGLTIVDAARAAPEVHATVRGGSVFAHADGVRLALQQLGDGSVGIHASMRKESADWAQTCGYDVGSLAAVKEALLGEGGPLAGWHPTFREAVAKADGRCEARSLYMLPVGFSWPHRRGATLVGDAAHLMTPFAGEGVNLAMDDARRLAGAIIGAAEAVKRDGKKDLTAELDGAVEAFEKDMFTRAAKVAKLTDDLRKLWMFTPDVPDSVIVDAMTLHVKFSSPAIVHPFVAAAVHGYFFVQKFLR